MSVELRTMKTRYSLLLGALLAVVMVLFFTRNKKSKRLVVEDRVELLQTGLSNSTQKRNDIEPIMPQTILQTSGPIKSTGATLSSPVLSEGVLKQFAQHLKAMNNCIGVSGNSGVGERSEPTIDNVLINLSKSLGDVAAQMEDWTQVEVIDKNSEKKRIRVDLDYYEGNTPTKRLSMYKINSYGMPEVMELTSDQANNPNDSYIDSLKEEVKVVSEEKGARAYFSNGEEVVFSVKNGVLQTLSINKYDKSFNCFNLELENSSCSCP